MSACRVETARTVPVEGKSYRVVPLLASGSRNSGCSAVARYGAAGLWI